MLPVVLALLIYTISLRLIVNTCFLQVSASPQQSPVLRNLMLPQELPHLVEIFSCCAHPWYFLHGRC